MTVRMESVSDHLILIRHALQERRQDGLSLAGIDLDDFIGRINRVIDTARILESAWSAAEWNKRAFLDQLVIAQRQAQTIEALLTGMGIPLPALKPETAVVLPFRRPAVGSVTGPYDGGHAA